MLGVAVIAVELPAQMVGLVADALALNADGWPTVELIVSVHPFVSFIIILYGPANNPLNTFDN